MNELSDSYALTITTDATTALILAEALADWDLGVCLPDGAGSATLEIFGATRAEAESHLRALRALAPRAHFGTVTIKPVERQDWVESWKLFFMLSACRNGLLSSHPGNRLWPSRRIASWKLTRA